MPVIRTILCVVLLALAVSCRRHESAAIDGVADLGGSEPVTARKDPALSVLRYDTGDRAEWPEYDLPIEHRFDLPEVPESIRGPFPLDTIPKDK